MIHVTTTDDVGGDVVLDLLRQSQDSPVTRITVDLDPPVHSILNLWIARNAAAIGPPHVQLAEVIGAMVVTTARYEDVTDTVCSQIRQQRAAAKDRGERGERGPG